MVFYKNATAQNLTNKDSVHYEMHLSSTLILSAGNLKRVVTQNRLTGNVGNKLVQFVTENSYRYSKNFNRVVENDMLTRNYVRFLPNHNMYSLIIGSYENNFRRSIKYRWQLGGGGAYSFYKKKKDFLRTSLAIVYEQAKYKTDTFNIAGFNGNPVIKETRLVLRFGGIHNILDNHVTLRHDTWFMEGLQNSKNYRWHSIVGLQIPIYNGLAFKTDYEYTYESITVSNKNPFGYASNTYDWVLSFGLSYDIRRGIKK